MIIRKWINHTSTSNASPIFKSTLTTSDSIRLIILIKFFRNFFLRTSGPHSACPQPGAFLTTPFRSNSICGRYKVNTSNSLLIRIKWRSDQGSAALLAKPAANYLAGRFPWIACSRLCLSLSHPFIPRRMSLHRRVKGMFSRDTNCKSWIVASTVVILNGPWVMVFEIKN